MAPEKSKTVISRVIATFLVCLIFMLGHLKPVECGRNQQCSYTQSLTNGKRFQIEDRFFSASSYYTGYPPEDARHLTNLKRCWCSEELQANSADDLQNAGRERPWLEVQFGATVIINDLAISGYAGLTWYYVTKFNIYYGNVGEELKPIKTEGQNGEDVTKDFTVIHPFEYRLLLDGPIVTQRLQIVPLEWNNRYACMSIEAEGCLAEGPTCVGNQLISTDRSLLPLSEITAEETTTVGDFHLRNLVDNVGGDSDHFDYFPWCFETNFKENPYVELKFNKPIWLTHVRTRRHPLSGISISRGYITNISLQYADASTDDSFAKYSDLHGKYILADTGTQFKTFWAPVEGSAIRLNINNGVAAVVDTSVKMYCWNILLYGCTAEQEAASSQLLGNSSNSTVAMQVGVLIGCVLGLITLSVLAIVVVVVVIKWRKRSRQDRENEPTISSEQLRDRSLTDTMLESLAYTWERNESIDTSTVSESASMQSENELQTPQRLREPLLEPITEESNSED